jgi:hypothetical protein
MVLQLLLGGFVGGLVVFKLAAQNLLDKVLRRKHTDTQDEAEIAEEIGEKAA